MIVGYCFGAVCGACLYLVYSHPIISVHELRSCSLLVVVVSVPLAIWTQSICFEDIYIIDALKKAYRLVRYLGYRDMISDCYGIHRRHLCRGWRWFHGISGLLARNISLQWLIRVALPLYRQPMAACFICCWQWSRHSAFICPWFSHCWDEASIRSCFGKDRLCDGGGVILTILINSDNSSRYGSGWYTSLWYCTGCRLAVWPDVCLQSWLIARN